MKDKVVVRINIPIASLSYDMRIPYDLTVGTASQVISRMIKHQNENLIPLSHTPVLWESTNGKMIDQSKTIREIGAKDGDMFLLI